MSPAVASLLGLRWSLALLIASAVVGGGLVTLTRDLVRRADVDRNQLVSRQHDIRTRLDNVRQEELDTRERMARYRQILDSGLIVQEERLDWVERIERIKAARRLLDVEYELSPQHVVDEAALPGGSSAVPYQYLASTMRLKMALLHEEDLLHLLADLRSSVHAFLLVRDCQIGRAMEASPRQGLAPQLRAECTIDWITLREKKP